MLHFIKNMFPFKKTTQSLIMFSLLILILIGLDITVGKLYHILSPEFGRRNLELALIDATCSKNPKHLKF